MILTINKTPSDINKLKSQANSNKLLLERMDELKDISFNCLAFNELDSAIFSLLSNTDINGQNALHNNLSEKVAIPRSLSNKTKISKNTAMSDFSKNLEKSYALIGSCPRYKTVKLLKQETYFSRSDITQFSATSFQLDHETIYISFRGTDFSITAWYEDFLLAYKDTLPSHHHAVNFIAAHCKSYPDFKLVLGGHSKGGNIAFAAAVLSSADVQDHIIEVHSFDGPGLSTKLLENPSYKRIENKLKHFYPTDSLWGSLLTHSCKQKCVQSDNHGIYQHIPYLWHTNTDSFKAGKRSEISYNFMTTLNAWIRETEFQDKQNFIQLVFQLFFEVQNQKDSIVPPKSLLHFMARMIKVYFTQSKTNKNIIKKGIKGLYKSYRQTKKSPKTN